MTETPTPIRSPRVAGVVADIVRARILNGEIGDDGRLPREEVLRGEFGVGKPAMREALRMLEEEGLISVVRGNRGGAVIRTPRAENIAYVLGLALTTRRVTASDLKDALLALEPLCASLCARRRDRRRAVVPALLELHREAEKKLDEPRTATALFRQLHEQIVSSCGNETLILLVGAIEALWSSHVMSSAAVAGESGQRRGAADLRASIDEHRQIISLIEKGDAEAVIPVLTKHLERVQRIPTAANTDTMLSMSDLRTRLRL